MSKLDRFFWGDLLVGHIFCFQGNDVLAYEYEHCNTWIWTGRNRKYETMVDTLYDEVRWSSKVPWGGRYVVGWNASCIPTNTWQSSWWTPSVTGKIFEGLGVDTMYLNYCDFINGFYCCAIGLNPFFTPHLSHVKYRYVLNGTIGLRQRGLQGFTHGWPMTWV